MMNPAVMLACGTAFVVVGLLFVVAGFYLKQPSSVQKAPISKVAGAIFYIMGALTVIAGAFALAFHAAAPKITVEIVLLAYLAAITILLVVFTYLIKGPGSH